MAKLDLEKLHAFHARRDPLKCVEGREKHEFAGCRMFPDGNGGEAVCKHCGVGAMSYTLAQDWP